MDTVILISVILIPFLAGILIGWGLRSLLSIKRRGLTSAKVNQSADIVPSKPGLPVFSREWIDHERERLRRPVR